MAFFKTAKEVSEEDRPPISLREKVEKGRLSLVNRGLDEEIFVNDHLDRQHPVYEDYEPTSIDWMACRAEASDLQVYAKDNNVIVVGGHLSKEQSDDFKSRFAENAKVIRPAILGDPIDIGFFPDEQFDQPNEIEQLKNLFPDVPTPVHDSLVSDVVAVFREEVRHMDEEPPEVKAMLSDRFGKKNTMFKIAKRVERGEEQAETIMTPEVAKAVELMR